MNNINPNRLICRVIHKDKGSDKGSGSDRPHPHHSSLLPTMLPKVMCHHHHPQVTLLPSAARGEAMTSWRGANRASGGLTLLTHPIEIPSFSITPQRRAGGGENRASGGQFIIIDIIATHKYQHLRQNNFISVINKNNINSRKRHALLNKITPKGR